MYNKVLLILAFGAAAACTEALRALEEKEPLADSAFIVYGDTGTGPADVFIYDAEGLQGLEAHLRLEPGQTGGSVQLSAGAKIAAVICNSPYEFNDEALGKYSSFSQVVFNFPDDDPYNPASSGTAYFIAGEDFMVQVDKLMCEVVLEEVSNGLDPGDYPLLENPRVWLCNLNASAEIMRTSDFRPVEMISKSSAVELPCDVGFFPQRPGITLHCYPVNTELGIVGTPQCSIVLECSVRGELREYRSALPSIPRGGTVHVSVRITEEGAEYSYSVRPVRR